MFTPKSGESGENLITWQLTLNRLTTESTIDWRVSMATKSKWSWRLLLGLIRIVVIFNVSPRDSNINLT